MQEREILDIFAKTGAYKQGHFRLSSGLHSGFYLQCALVLENPIIVERLCSALANKFRDVEPDVVIGPALGGIVLAYELARALGARAIFTERDDAGNMTLRRGFMVSPNNKVLVAEDVLTTGKSVNEVIHLLKKESIIPVGVASLVNRSGGTVTFGNVRSESLLNLNVPTFTPADCPLCKEGLAIEKPGSRKQ